MGKTVRVVGLVALVATASAWANPANTVIARMSDDERNRTFAKFIARSGESCTGVLRNFFQGFDRRGNATWNVSCASMRSFAITINNDSRGVTKIVRCEAWKALKKVECFERF